MLFLLVLASLHYKHWSERAGVLPLCVLTKCSTERLITLIHGLQHRKYGVCVSGGSSMSDLPLLLEANVSVCWFDAAPELKEVADFLTNLSHPLTIVEGVDAAQSHMSRLRRKNALDLNPR
eukprot:g43156.t1